MNLTNLSTASIPKKRVKISPEQIFMMSTLLVNGGNYLYNLIVGRLLGPAAFADAAVIITMLLVFSFMGMTFQILTTKYVCTLKDGMQVQFLSWLRRGALLGSIPFALLIYSTAPQLQSFFQTSSPLMFRLLAVGLPIYLHLSINRGVLQGKENFVALSVSYQGEMWTRLVATVVLLLLFPEFYVLIISGVVVLSLVAGSFPQPVKLSLRGVVPKPLAKQMIYFFVITAFYEVTQIAINNGDILLVKHYFPASDAGNYAALALIGRIVYFITWMLAMLLLPKVIRKAEQGERTLHMLSQYVGYSAAMGLAITAVCLAYPSEIVQVLFGVEYLAMAGLLWKYALATTLFAIANIFVYYFLALKQYVPVIITACFALLQLVGIILYHHSLAQVVMVQMVMMSFLCISQWGYFLMYRSQQA